MLISDFSITSVIFCRTKPTIRRCYLSYLQQTIQKPENPKSTYGTGLSKERIIEMRNVSLQM